MTRDQRNPYNSWKHIFECSVKLYQRVPVYYRPGPNDKDVDDFEREFKRLRRKLLGIILKTLPGDLALAFNHDWSHFINSVSCTRS